MGMPRVRGENLRHAGATAANRTAAKVEQSADRLILHRSGEILPAQLGDEIRHAARARPLHNEVVFRPKAASRAKRIVMASLNHLIHLFLRYESYE